MPRRPLLIRAKSVVEAKVGGCFASRLGTNPPKWAIYSPELRRHFPAAKSMGDAWLAAEKTVIAFSEMEEERRKEEENRKILKSFPVIGGRVILGRGSTKEEAWANAANNIEKAREAL